MRFEIYLLYRIMHIIHKLVLSLFLLWNLCIVVPLVAMENYGFRVYLKDKAESVYELDDPGSFLSEEALVRRQLRNIEVTEEDIPVSPIYIERLQELGTKPVVSSKWMNTVVVATEDSSVVTRIAALEMVDSVKWVWKGKQREEIYSREESDRLMPSKTLLKSHYGYAEKQIRMLNGVKLNKVGYTGEGMRVAVVDAGFLNVDRISAFDSLQLIGTRNIIFPEETVFAGDEHGTKVLSCMAANLPGLMVGTAPKASYLLLQSEDVRSEYPVEEDYWVAAVEYADSVGVDVISSSLGYYVFDSDELSYTHDELDGKTAFISRAASVVAEKGILLFSSAGNEGNGSWGKITFPADVPSLLSVGSVTDEKKKSSFSSVGLTADSRIKPDVVALGTGSCVIDWCGDIRYSSGTSFSTPILAGLGVCLWQALPDLTNLEIMELLRQAGSQCKTPDVELGYGIPDVYKAYKKGLKYVTTRSRE